MSQSDSPIRTMFDVQRTAARQSEQALKQGMQTQEAAGRLLLTGLRMQQTVGQQSLALAEAASRSYVETVEAMTGATRTAEAPRTLEETFARLQETHRQFYEVVDDQLQEGLDSQDELTEEYREALEETTDQLLETAETIENQSVEGLDEFTEQVNEQFERTQEMQTELEDGLEEGAEQTQELLERQADQAEQFQQELERQRQQLREQVETGARRTQQAAVPQNGGQPVVGHDLEEINGVGPATREDLEEVGVETLTDLAQADPAMVAEVAGVSEERAGEWIEQAVEWTSQPA